jgi:hypothetical protein
MLFVKAALDDFAVYLINSGVVAPFRPFAGATRIR